MLEPWLTRIEDLSVQMHVAGPTEIEILGTTRQILKPSGAVVGNRGLLDSDGRSISGTDHDPALVSAASTMAREAALRGFRGPCGTDAFSYRNADGQERLRPVVELNARFTTGIIALGLLKRATLPARRR